MSDSRIIAGFLAPDPSLREVEQPPYEAAEAALRVAKEAHEAWATAPEHERESRLRVYEEASSLALEAIFRQSAEVIGRLLPPQVW